MKLPGQPSVRTRVEAILARYPGLTSVELAKRMGARSSSISSTLLKGLRQGHYHRVLGQGARKGGVWYLGPEPCTNCRCSQEPI